VARVFGFNEILGLGLQVQGLVFELESLGVIVWGLGLEIMV
jgi:hypothetical protein